MVAREGKEGLLYVGACLVCSDELVGVEKIVFGLCRNVQGTNFFLFGPFPALSSRVKHVGVCISIVRVTVCFPIAFGLLWCILSFRWDRPDDYHRRCRRERMASLHSLSL